MLRLRKFMFERVYLGPEARSEHDRVIRTLRGLFDHYLDASGAGRGRGAGRGDDLQRGHRLHRRDDRPLRDRDLPAPGAARGVAPCEPVHHTTASSGSRRRPTSSRSSPPTRTCGASGTRFTGLCPFHDERTPSFSVDPQEKLYHCFGCGVGGDVIRFVEEKEGLSFADAVEALADRYGVELEREQEDPRAEEQRKQRARLGELLERTAGFYASFLRDAPQAAKAREYLPSAGWARRCWRSSGSAARRAPGTRCWCAASRPATRSRRSRRPGWF